METEGYVLPVIIGIGSSLIATGIFIGFSELCRRLIFPWISDKIYRGVRVDGAWWIDSQASNLPEGAKMEMELKQWGDRITGSAFTEDKDGRTMYEIHGVLKNLYVMAYMEPKSAKMIDASAVVFYVEHQGACLHLKGSLLHKEEADKVGCWQGLDFVQKTL